MIWNIPNILTILRLLAAPGVAVMFLYFRRPDADWAALGLFLAASLTDWFDGYLARRWGQESKFGAMLDPIADKAMVLIALLLISSYSGTNPWLILPAMVIIFREVFVSGLREFLGADAGRLKVTKLAKWKTSAQMVAIAVLFLATGLDFEHIQLYRHTMPDTYQALLASGPQDWNRTWLVATSAGYAAITGLVLIWVAALLTLITGLDYFIKALPFLRGGVKK